MEVLPPYKHHDEVGDLHGRLTIVSASFMLVRAAKKRRFHICTCECGQIKVIGRGSLLSGNANSCGCLKRERIAEASTTHGGYDSPEYVTRRNMIQRCYSGDAEAYAGVLVCDRWLYGEGDLSGLECFLKDMGKKPGSNYSIDRIRSEGNYEPGNCQWLLKVDNDSKARGKRYA